MELLVASDNLRSHCSEAATSHGTGGAQESSPHLRLPSGTPCTTLRTFPTHQEAPCGARVPKPMCNREPVRRRDDGTCPRGSGGSRGLNILSIRGMSSVRVKHAEKAWKQEARSTGDRAAPPHSGRDSPAVSRPSHPASPTPGHGIQASGASRALRAGWQRGRSVLLRPPPRCQANPATPLVRQRG